MYTTTDLFFSFNTQPPEGGWPPFRGLFYFNERFNTQPPEGGWPIGWLIALLANWFQHTAARRRLVHALFPVNEFNRVSTHSRPKAAGQYAFPKVSFFLVSTHSRPKAAGAVAPLNKQDSNCFNTQPPEGGWVGMALLSVYVVMFQHTAARRRLETVYHHSV